MRVTSSRRLCAFGGAVGLAFVSCACSGSDQPGGPVVAGPSRATEVTPASALATTTVTSTSAPTTETTQPIVTTSAPATAGASTGPSTVDAQYRRVAPPRFPDHSSVPAGAGLPNGTYYAVVTGPSTSGQSGASVTASIYEVLTGGPAISAAAADGAGLDSDVYVRPKPVAVRQIALTSQLLISVAQPDKPDLSYAVAPAELVRLLRGGPPGPGAPVTYHYIPFPYLITVAGGAPTRLEQLWSP
jgi:hypothetical protein